MTTPPTSSPFPLNIEKWLFRLFQTLFFFFVLTFFSVCVITFDRIRSAWFFCLVITPGLFIYIETYGLLEVHGTPHSVDAVSTWLGGFSENSPRLAAVTLRSAETLVFILLPLVLFGRVAIIGGPSDDGERKRVPARCCDVPLVVRTAAKWRPPSPRVEPAQITCAMSIDLRDGEFDLQIPSAHRVNFCAGSEENRRVRTERGFFLMGENRQQQQSPVSGGVCP